MSPTVPAGQDNQDADATKEEPPSAAGEATQVVHEVWSWNFDSEFDALIAAASAEDVPGGSILALDMEFPGFLRQESRTGGTAMRYQVLRENVDRLRPIQLGAAVANADGILKGVWSFNLQFDLSIDLHTEKAVSFLKAAGIDFPRHAKEGIEAAAFGRRLAGSTLVGHQQTLSPWWITFSGSYDLGYLLKLLIDNRPLPQDVEAFDTALAAFCPRRHDLRDQLPYGSLVALARQHSVHRHGSAHTAGSDALLTLDLFIRIMGANLRYAVGSTGRGAPKAARNWSQWEDDHWRAMQGHSNWQAYLGSGWDGSWERPCSTQPMSWNPSYYDAHDHGGTFPWPAVSVVQATVAPQLYRVTGNASATALAQAATSLHPAFWAAHGVQGGAVKRDGVVDPVAAAAAGRWRMSMMGMGVTGMMGWRTPEVSKVLAI